MSGGTALILLLSACDDSSDTQPLTHQAYIWQHRWTPALSDALNQSAPSIDGWRVLAAEANAQSRLQAIAIHTQDLQKTAKPVVAVIRINGQLVDWQGQQIAAQSLKLLDDWRAAGLNVQGLEIDHDSATVQLPRYAEFLQALATQLHARHKRLSITALPAWLTAPDLLLKVLQPVDEAVLQVHAVKNPRQGQLFAAQQAEQWINDFNQLSRKPFRVALPNYASRVAWDAQGKVRVESEAPVDLPDADTQELNVRPTEVAQLLQTLQQYRPDHLQGIVWFRLPTAADQRAWSISTWLAVINGQPLAGRMSVVTLQSADGLYDVQLRNDGAIDAELPQQVLLKSAPRCTAADAIGGYHLAPSPDNPVFQLAHPGRLKAQHSLNIGWLRCSQQELSFEIDPSVP